MDKKILSLIFVFFLIGSLGFSLAEGNKSVATTMDSKNIEKVQERIQIQEGEHLGINGEKFNIQTQANNRVQIKAGNVSADCDCQITQERVENKTQLFVKMSNGKNAEIKVMPNVASKKALERLKIKVCSEENRCQIELKEVGSGEKTQLAYELQTQRQAKILGLFKTRMHVTAHVNAEDGEIIKVKKPWWAFLASEPAEE